MSTVKVLGYSERGIFNSIVFSLREHPEHIQCFLKILDLKAEDLFVDCEYTFLNEQSFSDFGYNDWTIIAEKREKKRVIFIEGKIKTFQGKFSIDKELSECENWKAKKSPSDVFTQLYYKYLLSQLSDSRIYKNSKIGKKEKKLGENEIVKNAYEKYIKNADKYYYVAILPEKIDSKEFQEKIKRLNLFKDGDIESVKCAYWGDIERYFKSENVLEVKGNFDFNKDEKTGNSQIYKR